MLRAVRYPKGRQCISCRAGQTDSCARRRMDLLGELFQCFCMQPTLAQATVFKRNEDAYCQHAGVPLRRFILLVDECADARIAILNEVPVLLLATGSYRLRATAYTRSCSTLCSPEGRDLNSTALSTCTAVRQSTVPNETGGFVPPSMALCQSRT